MEDKTTILKKFANEAKTSKDQSKKGKYKKWFAFSALGITSMAATAGITKVVGWENPLDVDTPSTPPEPLDADNLKESLTAVNSKSLENALATAREEVGSNGWFNWNGNPHPTLYPSEIVALPLEQKNQLFTGVLSNHKDTYSQPRQKGIDMPENPEFNEIDDTSITRKDAWSVERELHGAGSYFKYDGKIYSTYSPDEIETLKESGIWSEHLNESAQKIGIEPGTIEDIPDDFMPENTEVILLDPIEPINTIAIDGSADSNGNTSVKLFLNADSSITIIAETGVENITQIEIGTLSPDVSVEIYIEPAYQFDGVEQYTDTVIPDTIEETIPNIPDTPEDMQKFDFSDETSETEVDNPLPIPPIDVIQPTKPDDDTIDEDDSNENDTDKDSKDENNSDENFSDEDIIGKDGSGIQPEPEIVEPNTYLDDNKRVDTQNTETEAPAEIASVEEQNIADIPEPDNTTFDNSSYTQEDYSNDQLFDSNI